MLKELKRYLKNEQNKVRNPAQSREYAVRNQEEGAYLL